MNTPKKTIDLTPTWGYAVSIYIAVLENPTAGAEAKQAARADLQALAAIVDNANNT